MKYIKFFENSEYDKIYSKVDVVIFLNTFINYSNKFGDGDGFWDWKRDSEFFYFLEEQGLKETWEKTYGKFKKNKNYESY